jgi:hypothetical protein
VHYGSVRQRQERRQSAPPHNRIVIPAPRTQHGTRRWDYAGSLTLVGGDPGVGKSTLLLQIAASGMATPAPGIGRGPAVVPCTSTGDIMTPGCWSRLVRVGREENPQCRLPVVLASRYPRNPSACSVKRTRIPAGTDCVTSSRSSAGRAGRRH